MAANPEQAQRRPPRRARNRSKLLGKQPIDSVMFKGGLANPHNLEQVVDFQTISAWPSPKFVRISKVFCSWAFNSPDPRVVRHFRHNTWFFRRPCEVTEPRRRVRRLNAQLPDISRSAVCFDRVIR